METFLSALELRKTGKQNISKLFLTLLKLSGIPVQGSSQNEMKTISKTIGF